MIFPGTFLISADNSGAYTAKCIKVRRRFFGLNGDIIIITIKSHNPGRPKIRTHQIHRAVLVQSKRLMPRAIGHISAFGKNAFVILKKTDDLPVATKVIGPVCFELRKKGFFRLIVMGLFVF